MPDPKSFQLPREMLIVGAAVQRGLFDAIKNEPGTLKQLAAKTGSDTRALWTVTEALIALDYLHYDGDLIKLTPEADDILFNPRHQQYVGYSFMHAYNIMKSWVQLPEVMSTGQPVPVKNKSVHTKHFIQAMSKVAQKSAPQIADYCLHDLPANAKVLDVGGGPLTYAMAFAGLGAQVTVLDLPDVIDMMQPHLDPKQPIEMVKGDFTQGLPPGSYDLVYLGNVCHIYGEEENRKLFQDAAGVLNPGGHIIVNDMIRGTGTMAALFAVNMLVNTASGGTWTFEQYQSWLQGAGFTVNPWEEVGTRQLIKAIKN